MRLNLSTGLLGLLIALAFQRPRPETFQRSRPEIFDSGASLSGVVVRAGTNLPIPGATVELTGIAPRTVEGSSSVGRGVISVSVLEADSDGRILSFSTTTRGDGTFEIRGVPPNGNYQLIAVQSPEYLPAQYGQRVPALPGRPITLNPGDQLRDLRIEMTPGGSISGSVVDARGFPVRNVVVELRRPWYLEGWRLLSDWNQVVGRLRGIGKSNRAATMATNARGEFSFSGLAPAQYYLRTNFSDEENLSPVNLHAGDRVADLRIVAPESGGREIQGIVLGPNGTVVTNARVAVLRSGAIPLYETSTLDTDTVRPNSNGGFRLEVPRSGRYLLIAAGPGGNGDAMRAHKEIDVRDFLVSGVRLQLMPPVSLSGRVTYEGGAPPRISRDDAMSIALYPMSMNIGTVTPATLPAGNGVFTLQDVAPGDYRVEVRPILSVPPGALVPSGLERAYVKSVRMDGKDILNSGLHLESFTNASIEVVIHMNGGTLTGRVLDAAGAPVRNVNAVVVPNAPRRHRGDLYKYVSTDDSGNFQLTGLAPGDYKLFAWERVEEGAWQDAEFIRLFESSGSAVRIEDNRRTTADAKVIPAWN